jgi:hypothetical protein
MRSRFFLTLAACLLAVAASGINPAPVHAAGACDKLQAEFTGKLRPAILRLAKTRFHLSNWYHATLKRQHEGSKHPTPAALDTTYKMMVDYCGSDSKCKTFAAQMNTASRAIYDVNRRWSAAGCPGQLDK